MSATTIKSSIGGPKHAEHKRESTRIAAVGDLHCSRAAKGQLHDFFAKMAEDADVLAICGDLTDYGLPEEARILAEELKGAANVPIVAVLGNHDYESGRQDEVKGILEAGGVRILDGESLIVGGVGIAGIKGFMGGFGRRALQPWGEQTTKVFVREAVEEALKLESALARLRMPQRVVLMHYSPIAGTVAGEPSEIVPYLGSSRLEDPLNRHSVTAVFHGHAHHGSAEGRTAGGTQVFNVAMPLLKHVNPDSPPFRQMRLPPEKTAAP